jgi:hypothetical protein
MNESYKLLSFHSRFFWFNNLVGYPLRPEMAESIYYLSTVINDPIWKQFGRDIVHNLNLTRVV